MEHIIRELVTRKCSSRVPGNETQTLASPSDGMMLIPIQNVRTEGGGVITIVRKLYIIPYLCQFSCLQSLPWLKGPVGLMYGKDILDIGLNKSQHYFLAMLLK